jgi:hypothetical protein
MPATHPENIFTREVLSDLLPQHLSNAFFEALYGDADEGAYDISLSFKNYAADKRELSFELQLHERPDKCLACRLTYGLPQVFSRHPVINIQGMVEKIVALLEDETKSFGWELGQTREPAANMHVIPLTIWLG